jgi:pimeloyl-ACP methyl ester carboxylesterase
MSLTKSDTIQVPGACLYYQTQGSGPLLLILQGGDGDADGSMSLADHLAEHYTVVTYDRRGLSRSKLDEPFEAPRLETHSNDAHLLLATLTTEPALVFGASMGALIGLDLVARHPEQIRMFVAHEAPTLEPLPDAERASAAQAQEEVDEIYRSEGLAAAMKKKLAQSGLNFADREPDVVLPQPGPYRAANLAFFYAYDAPSAHRYRLDMAALKKAAAQIVITGGRTSREIWLYHSAEALASQLGTAFVEFPGGHNGYVLHPRAFAERLHDVFDKKQRKAMI